MYLLRPCRDVPGMDNQTGGYHCIRRIGIEIKKVETNRERDVTRNGRYGRKGIKTGGRNLPMASRYPSGQ